LLARSDVDIELQLLHPLEPGGAAAGKILSRSIAAAQATGGGVRGSPLGSLQLQAVSGSSLRVPRAG